MTIQGIRYCQVLNAQSAEDFAQWLGEKGWGFEPREMPKLAEGFQGAVFASARDSDKTWAEIWPEGEGMDQGTMLQIVVDDANAYAEQARANGIEVHGPVEMFGERICFAQSPDGTKVAVLSKIAS